MQDSKSDHSLETKDSEDNVAASAETSAETTAEPSVETLDTSRDILEVTEMEQSPEQSPEQESLPDEEAAAEPPPRTEPEPPLPPEFDKYWKAVEANPEEFTTWTYLLHYIEQENHIYAARRVFDMFLAHYPYCYGYWKKYADLERRNNNIMEADEVILMLSRH